MDKYFLALIILVIISIVLVLFVRFSRKISTVKEKDNPLTKGDNFTFLE